MANQALDDQLVQYLGEAKPTLVCFFSPTCPRCAEMRPVIEEKKKKIGDRANFVEVDTTQSQDLMKTYKVDSHPYYILFKDGQEVWRDGGRKPYSEIIDMVRRFI